MPTVSFSVSRNADNDNLLSIGGFTVGPNGGNASFTFTSGQTYGYGASGNGEGGVNYRVNSTTEIGLDDLQGTGKEDNDYNDLVVRITSGNAEFRGNGMYVFYETPVISFFSASPNPQNSADGTPKYSTVLSWGSTKGTAATITSPVGESWNVTTTGSWTITTLPQSVAGSNSPAKREYTLRVYNPEQQAFSYVTVDAYNDNTPSNSWTTSFSNLNPNTQVTLTLGNLSGVDMPTTISTSGGGNFVGNGGSFSGSRNFSNGDTVQLRTTTLGYNTSLSGVSANATFGNTNTKTVRINTPSGSFDVNVTTRAPRIKEDFNYANAVNKYPYEDIDLIDNNPLEFTTSAQIQANDVDIAVEVKVDKPDAQVRINNGTWRNVRSI